MGTFRKYYNEAYCILGQIDDQDSFEATMYVLMKMWADKHGIKFLPMLVTWFGNVYEEETGNNFILDTTRVGVEAILGSDIRAIKEIMGEAN